jgi:hypothetical protein
MSADHTAPVASDETHKTLASTGPNTDHEEVEAGEKRKADVVIGGDDEKK